jgi:hypothetical protein
MKLMIGFMRQLFAIFVDDGSLAIAIVVVVAFAATLSFVFHLSPVMFGAALVFGTIFALLENILRVCRKG